MVKTILVLPDGREISSGPGTENAIQSCTYTQCVNAGTELTVGSVCAAMAELRLITPGGGLSVAAGEELTLWQYDGTARRKLGIFIAEKPQRPSAHTLRITAYDRVSLLDRDISGFLAEQSDWPISLYDLAQRVCRVCGVDLQNTQLPNGSFPVQPFTGHAITGRQLMRYIGQLAGCFCRATADGQLEFAWYTPASCSLGPDRGDWHYADATLWLRDPQAQSTRENGVLTVTAPHWTVADEGLHLTTGSRQYYFAGSLSYADYAVAPIEKVQLRQTEEDVGAIWPDTTNAANTYRITGNPLLAGAATGQLESLAQSLYDRLKTVTYTPCRVSVPADTAVEAGEILTLTDKNGKSFRVYVMTKTQTGQKLTLECTGAYRRDSVTAVNEQSYEALSGKVLNLRTDIDGIRAENKAADGRVGRLELSVEGLSAQTEKQTADADALRTALTRLQQTADSVQITVQTMQQQGVSRVHTHMGYTFDDEGLRIARQGQQMENLLDNTGMYVTRGGQAILKASIDGVEATDVAVGNYLTVASSRLEAYEGNRTACFYIGG